MDLPIHFADKCKCGYQSHGSIYICISSLYWFAQKILVSGTNMVQNHIWSHEGSLHHGASIKSNITLHSRSVTDFSPEAMIETPSSVNHVELHGSLQLLVRIYHNLIWFLLKSPWWNDLDCGFCAISLRKQRSKITSEKRSERTLQHGIGTRVTKIRGPKKGSFFIRRNANRNIENHLPMSWTLLNAILSSALRQKSRVFAQQTVYKQRSCEQKSNNHPLMFVLSEGSEPVTFNWFINRDPFNSSWNNHYNISG